MRIIEGEHGDRPLPGPWERRRDPGPVSAEAGPEEIPAPPEREGGNIKPPASRTPFPAAETTAGPPETTTTAPPEPAAAGPEPRGPAPESSCSAPVHGKAFIKWLLRPAGIYAGVVMAEVLGARGGRRGRRAAGLGFRITQPSGEGDFIEEVQGGGLPDDGGGRQKKKS